MDINKGAALIFRGDSMCSFHHETSSGSITSCKSCSDTHVCIKVQDMTKYRCNSTYHIVTNKYVKT
jgi:hypothetical protein